MGGEYKAIRRVHRATGVDVSLMDRSTDTLARVSHSYVARKKPSETSKGPVMIWVLAALVDLFGDEPEMWTSTIIDLWIAHFTSLSFRRFNRSLLYFLLRLDGHCFTFKHIHALSRHLQHREGYDWTRNIKKIAIHFGRGYSHLLPDTFQFPTDVIRRMPDDAFREQEYDRIFHAVRYMQSKTHPPFPKDVFRRFPPDLLRYKGIEWDISVLEMILVTDAHLVDCLPPSFVDDSRGVIPSRFLDHLFWFNKHPLAPGTYRKISKLVKEEELQSTTIPSHLNALNQKRDVMTEHLRLWTDIHSLPPFSDADIYSMCVSDQPMSTHLPCDDPTCRCHIEMVRIRPNLPSTDKLYDVMEADHKKILAFHAFLSEITPPITAKRCDT